MAPSMMRDTAASDGADCAFETVLMADVLFCEAAIYSVVGLVFTVFGQACHRLAKVGYLATS